MKTDNAMLLALSSLHHLQTKPEQKNTYALTLITWFNVPDVLITPPLHQLRNNNNNLNLLSDWNGLLGYYFTPSIPHLNVKRLYIIIIIIMMLTVVSSTLFGNVYCHPWGSHCNWDTFTNPLPNLAGLALLYAVSLYNVISARLSWTNQSKGSSQLGRSRGLFASSILLPFRYTISLNVAIISTFINVWIMLYCVYYISLHSILCLYIKSMPFNITRKTWQTCLAQLVHWNCGRRDMTWSVYTDSQR